MKQLTPAVKLEEMHSCKKPGRNRPARAMTLAALGIGLSIPLVILAAALPQVRAGYSRASTTPSAASPFQFSLLLGPMTPRTYFHSGQWRADLLTLAAAVRYAVEPEPDLPILQPKTIVTV